MTKSCFAKMAGFLALLLIWIVVASLPAKAQMDPSGEWAPQFDEDQLERVPGPDIGDYLGLPINSAARLRGESWEASLLELPVNQCRPHPSDYAWRGPANLRIWKEVDRPTEQVIAYHTHISWQAAEQTIYMDGRPHPPAWAAHTWQGFSTGHWEGDILAVFTDHLKEGWIRRNGIDRSDKATVSTHIMRHANVLTVAVLVYDPVYLTEPFLRTTDFFFAPQQHINPYPCESVEEVAGVPGRVPNFLPGKNPYISEFAAHYGIPLQAALGGAQTMYPEYQQKLASMAKLPRPANQPSF